MNCKKYTIEETKELYLKALDYSNTLSKKYVNFEKGIIGTSKINIKFHIPINTSEPLISFEDDFTYLNKKLKELIPECIGKIIENLIWLGGFNDKPNNTFKGFLKIMTDNANTIKVSAPITITSANVLAELERGYNLIPDGILNSSNLRLYVSIPVWRAYTSALGTEASNYQWDIQKGFTNVFYKGVQVLPVQGMSSESRYIFSEKSNLAFGIDLLYNLENVHIIDLRKTIGVEKLCISGEIKVGAECYNAKEIVLY